MVVRVILSLTIALTTSSAFAHGTGQHVLGTVTAIDTKHIEVRTPKGTVVDVQLDKQTRYKAKGKPKSLVPPAIGDRVVIEATKDEKKGLTATEVHYASAGLPNQPAPSAAPAPMVTP